MANVEGYAVTFDYYTPAAYPQTLGEAKRISDQLRAEWPEREAMTFGAIWRLFDDGTRKLVRKGGRTGAQGQGG